MPLHSAIASARLTSNIAVDSTCWSSLSLGNPLTQFFYFLLTFFLVELFSLSVFSGKGYLILLVAYIAIPVTRCREGSVF